VTDELIIDQRVHSRLIGAKGKAISKVTCEHSCTQLTLVIGDGEIQCNY
jgi:hypothetical protein